MHDFNNTMTSILGYAELIAKISIEGSQQKKFAEYMVASANSAIRLIRQIQAFKKGEEHATADIGVHGVLDDVVNLLESLLRGNVKVTKEFEAPKDVVKANPTGLFQVFLNLAVNARDAMPSGGEIVFSTRNAFLSDKEGGKTDETTRKSLLISVRDTGTGIPPEVAPRIFNPFFTTKQSGTGLGLAVVKRTVDQIGGSIWFETASGRGTTFFISLPLAVGSGDGPSTSGGLILGSGRIMIVDSDDFAMDAMSETIKALGYRTTCFSSPVRAASFYKDAFGSIDVVLIERDLQGGGNEFFRILRSHNQAVKAFLITAQDVREIKSGECDKTVLGVLQKPLNMSQISRMLDWAMKLAPG